MQGLIKLQPKIDHELIIISDVHLIDDSDQRSRLLLQLLLNLDLKKLRSLVLLGDIFDFCIGASPYFQKKYAMFGEKLSALSKEGVAVHFVEGNHEFILGDLPWGGVNFIRDEELIIKLSDGKTVSFIHGDCLHAPWHYRLYSTIIRSQLSKFCALRVPQKQLDKLALYISSKSRDRSYAKRLDQEKLIADFRAWMRSSPADFAITGHFHIPFDIKLHEEKSRIFGLDSWDKPNCLAYKNGEFSRFFFDPSGEYKSVNLG